MQKISPCLWYNNQAEEAVNLYTSAFAGSRIMDVMRYGDAGPGPAGSVLLVNFELAGQRFIALNGGTQFQFTPAVSFFVNCDTREELDQRWDKLSAGGMVLMEPGEYPFSKRFGWLSDRYGVSWQLSLGSHQQKIIPSVLFVGKQHGRAEEAMNFYVSLFKNSRLQELRRHAPGGAERAGTVEYARFALHGQEFMAMDSGLDHAFTFTPAISFYVDCQTQAEVDTLWDALVAGGQPSQCGWLEDRFGVSWQIIPTILATLLGDPDAVKAQRVMQAMLQMVKIDAAALQRAYDQA
jgi:predicted 3-demethylubiquinone-9 3-methyltransferase (glyoxalase superfamily)